MLRLSAEGLALFLIPFVVYAALLLLGSRFPVLRQSGLGVHGLALATCGASLVVLGLLALGILGGRARGTYVPAHMERGTLVPGRLE